VNNKEGLSSSLAAHRRQTLAEERSKPDYNQQRIEQGIREKALAERRLTEVKDLLDSQTTKPLKDCTSEEVGLRVEVIWLEFRLERISQAKRQSQLRKLLNGLEVENPLVFQWLTGEDEEGKTELARIRDQIIPPIEIKGFHTKRR
jgi:hypothetical protein